MLLGTNRLLMPAFAMQTNYESKHEPNVTILLQCVCDVDWSVSGSVSTVHNAKYEIENVIGLENKLKAFDWNN